MDWAGLGLDGRTETWMTFADCCEPQRKTHGSSSRSLLPLLQEQAVPQIEVQSWCPRPQSALIGRVKG
jgi:hypothetical protein